MNYEDKSRETEDVQVEAALRHFRESVHGWSEREFGKTRTVRRSRLNAILDAMFHVIAKPAVGWSLAAAMLAAAAGVPVAVHHEREIAKEQQLTIERQEQAKLEAAKQQAATAMNDDELMSHVDSDIAQAAPDAMEPLASLISDTTVSK